MKNINKKLILFILLLLLLTSKISESHLMGNNITVIKRGNYEVYFTISPSNYIPNTPSMLSFSILKEGSHITNVDVSLKIEKDGKILYSFDKVNFFIGDFDVKYTFPDYGLYKITLDIYTNNDHLTIPIDLDLTNTPDYNFAIILISVVIGLGIVGFLFIKRRS